MKPLREYLSTTPSSYDTQNSYFLSDDQSLGVVIECEPISICDEEKINLIPCLLNHPFPTRSLLQILLYPSSDISNYLPTPTSSSVASQLVYARNQYLQELTNTPMPEVPCIHNARLFISLKIQQSLLTSGDHHDALAHKWRNTLLALLTQLGFKPKELDSNTYAQLLHTIFPQQFASTQSRIIKSVIEKISSPDIIDPTESNHSYRTLSFVQTEPFETNTFNSFFFKLPVLKAKCASCLNVFYPDPKIRNEIEFKKRLYNTKLLSVLNPTLRLKEKIIDEIRFSIQDGSAPVQVQQTFIAFSEDKHEAEMSLNQLEKLAHLHGASLAPTEDTTGQLLDCLPLFTSISPGRLKKYLTTTTHLASKLIPACSDWKGNPKATLSVVSSNSQIVSMSVRDSHALIIGGAGSGKTYFASEMITSNLAQGSNVWVVDRGGSYKQLCESLGGTYISLNPSTNFSLDPFATTPFSEPEDSERQIEAFIGLIRCIAPTSLASVEIRLSHIIQDLLDLTGTNTTIDAVAKICLNDKDPDVQTIGINLIPFTSTGIYGRYFSRDNHSLFTAQFVVIDLVSFTSHPHLLQVFIYVLINQMCSAVATKKSGLVHTCLFLDEISTFLQYLPYTFLRATLSHLYKYSASLIINVQDFCHFTSTESGRLLLERSGIKFIFRTHQIGSILNHIQYSNLDIKTIYNLHVVPNQYSEFVAITNKGFGVCRYFPAPQFRSKLSSSKTLNNTVKEQNELPNHLPKIASV